MAKFTSAAQVLNEFDARSGNTGRLKEHAGIRREDVERLAPILEKRLLKSDYNQLVGYGFHEIMEAMSSLESNCDSRAYYEAFSQGSAVSESVLASEKSEYNTMISEGFEAGTPALSPFPVPAVSLVMYAYEATVAPFFAHMFDLIGNRGLIYFQRITAKKAKGNIAAGDLLGSPKEMPKQNITFVGNKAIDVEIATATSGQTSFDITLPTKYGKPIQPGTLVIRVEGQDGHFVDVGATQDAVKLGKQDLLSVNGQLGTATIEYATNKVTMTLATGLAVGKKVYATFAMDIETADTENIAEVEMTLDTKRLVAENFGVKIDTNIYQEALSRALFGLDWNGEVDKALATLYNKEIANKILTEIKAAIPAQSLATHDISNGIKATSGALGGNNALFNTQFIAVVLGKLRALIAKAAGITMSRVSAIAINIDVLPIISALPGYREAELMAEENQGGMLLAGTYMGIPVVVGFEPVLAKGEVVAVYKSAKTAFLAPYAFGQQILPVIRDIYDQNNLAVNHKQLIASAAGEVVAERLAAKLTINGIDEIL